MLSLLMLAQAAQPAVIMTPPPIVMQTVTSDARGKRPEVRATLEVRVEGGGQELWSGSLRVSSGSNTSVRRELSEPPAIRCENGVTGNEATSLHISLMPSYVPIEATTTTGTTFYVTVRWVRPGEVSCVSRQSSRTVEMVEAVTLMSGKTYVLSGDGGLKVTVRQK